MKEGKLTPEQARMLLEQYKKQHANSDAKESAKAMDQYIKDGKLSLEAANELLTAQKKKVSPAEYSAILKNLVKQGKVDPDTAQRLMNQYLQQRSKEIVMQSIMSIKKMAQAGQLTPDVEKELVEMEQKMVPVDQYAAKLQGFVDAGKLTPAVSKTILDEFRQQKQDMGGVSSIDPMIKSAEDAAYAELRDLQKDGKITPDTANQIGGMIQSNVPFSQFQETISKLVQEGKLTPEISKLKLADYKKVKDLRDISAKLSDLQANNAPCTDHQAFLQEAVAAGQATPDEAAQLVKDCQNAQLAAPVVPAGGDDGGFAQLQERLQSATSTTTATAAQGLTTGDTADSFALAQSRAAAEVEQERQARIEAIATNMQGQAGQLIAAWQPPVMAHKEAAPVIIDKDKVKAAGAGAGGANGAATSTTTTDNAAQAVMVKAGSILFAVLDTAANSDYVDSPIMATIVDGKFKGAKLLGKLVTTKGVSGQMDRVTLNFTMMNMDAWPKSKTITAYAIDPDTARTVLASEVNYHYMQRFGAMMATSFLSGYGQATQSSGGQSVTSAFGTSSTNPTLSPSNKLAVAIGQMASAVGDATKNYVNMPPTVKVDSGVGLGILFMSDVT
jgi:polyhydroxyalkanoate synthesis regulator phasin